MSAAKRRIKRKIKMLGIAALVVIAGCKPQERSYNDQCLRREIFMQCMAALPVGPVSTHNNDWGKVVDECDSTAQRLSIREERHIKPECRP